MNHTDALQSQIAEKYILGELTEPLRDAYEEHYFDCAACAMDVKALSTFLDVSRGMLLAPSQVQENNAVPSTAKASASAGWWGWLHPVWMVPALAALVLALGYQNLVTIPAARNAGVSAGQPLTGYSLQMADTRSEGGVVLTVRPNESFTLDFDFTPAKTFGGYTYQLQEENGKVVFQRELAGDKANQELHLAIPSGTVHPGVYSLVFFGGTGTQFQSVPETQVSRLRFKIEFQR